MLPSRSGRTATIPLAYRRDGAALVAPCTIAFAHSR